MKTFGRPVMTVQKLEQESILNTSNPCFETFACKDCYCELVQCPDGYTCVGLDCPTLSEYD